MRLSPLDICIVSAFVLYAVLAGLRNRRRASRNLEEYFLAGRTLSGWQAGLSMAATQFAADTPLLVTGIIATAGIFGLWQLWIYALAFLMMGFVLAGSWRRAGVVTDAELTELRYGKRPATILRGLKAVYFGIIFNCTVLAWVFFAATRIAEPFLLWDRWLPAPLFQPLLALVESVGFRLTALPPGDPGVWIHTANNLISLLVILLVTTFYSATGGLRSVVATDVVQIAIMLLSTLLFAVVVVARAGGLDAIDERIHSLFAGGGPGGITPTEILAFTPDRAKDATGAVLLLFGLQWLIQLNADGTGYLAQRSMACRDARQAKIAAVVFTFTQVLVRSLLWLPLGLGLLLLFPPDLSLSGALLQADRESTFVRGMAELLPTGIRGLMLTGMLAALASTVDTHINWGSSYCANDIYKRLICQGVLKREPDPRTLVWVARLSNLFMVALALVIMTQLVSINQAWQTSLLLGAGLGIVLVLRWLWWRMNVWGEIAAIAASMVTAPILLKSVEQGAARLLIIAAVATAAALLAVFLAGPEDRERLRAFYARVRPPGFWRPVALEIYPAEYSGPARLKRSLSAMLFSSLSVFCLLTGIGSWLVGSPPPLFCPWPLAWSAGLIALGLALFPLWIRLGFSAAPD